MSRAIGLSEALPAPRVEPGPARVTIGAWGPEHLSAGAVAAVESLAVPGEVEPIVIRDAPLIAVLEEIERSHPAVVHLVAPVRFGPDGTEIDTVADEALTSRRLIDLLAGVERQPPVIVLDLHGPDDAPAGDSELAVGLAQLGFAAVLETGAALGRYEAEAFFKGFYEFLLGGRAIDVAVAQGRRRLTRRADSAGFGVPVLYMNHPGPVVATATHAVETRPPVPDEQNRSTVEPIDSSIRRRLRRALESAQPWRTLERLAIEAGVAEEAAAEVLHAEDDVRFSKGRSGHIIVGLISRVGP